MSSPKIVVDTDQMRAVGQRVEQAKERYNGAVQKLYNSVQAMQANWQGEDNQAYTDQIMGFQNDFTNMSTLLQQYADFLKNTATAYAETQDNVASDARALRKDA